MLIERQMRTPLMLMKESAKEEGTRNIKMEEQFSRHRAAQKRAYQMEDRGWVRDYRPGREK
ncbi:hypothetical protein ANCDUO_00152 [Ancylostoma duodenale]|uniref:Uncharacterized protein n=1 Tax=Ancylostoma duodenale TaxID=51022 RepID=A0A0C2H6K2_9BILA|nr:hypothetical protein ANCDUO_00152 [Ancylostoma duodenale]